MKIDKETSSGGRAGWVTKTIAFFLGAGGALGVLISVLMAIHLAHEQQTQRVISNIISALLFTWCVPTGIELWRGTPRGFKWAKILFAIQVPVFGAGRFVYEFSTLLSFRIMAGDTTHYVEETLDRQATFTFPPNPWVSCLALM